MQSDSTPFNNPSEDEDTFFILRNCETCKGVGAVVTREDGTIPCDDCEAEGFHLIPLRDATLEELEGEREELLDRLFEVHQAYCAKCEEAA